MLDKIDRKILGLMQVDASLSAQAIGEAVGLSATPCWRRIQRLERDGYVLRRVALLDAEKLNAGISVLVAIRTNEHTAEWLAAFHAAVDSCPEIVECFRLGGEIDYIMRVLIPDIRTYDTFYKKFIGKIKLNDVSSMFIMETIKSTTEVPLSYI